MLLHPSACYKRFTQFFGMRDQFGVCLRCHDLKD